MARHLMLVFTKPLPGREDEWNQWYDNIHIPQLLTFPTMIAAQRFRFSDESPGEPPENEQNLCIYEIETDDLEQSVAVFSDLSKMTMTDSFDPSAVRINYFSPFRPRAEAKTNN